MFPGEIAHVVLVGLLATVVGVILTALFGVVGVVLLSSVVEGALLIAAVVPTGKGGMSEKERNY